MRLKALIAIIVLLNTSAAQALNKKKLELISIKSQSPFYQITSKLEKKIEDSIEDNWYPPKIEANLRSIVKYELLDTGSYRLVTSESSSDYNFDQSCTMAIKRSNIDQVYSEISQLEVLCQQDYHRISGNPVLNIFSFPIRVLKGWVFKEAGINAIAPI